MNTEAANPVPALSTSGRYLVLTVAFLGWLCGGVHMSITQLSGQPAARDLLTRTGELEEADSQILNEGDQAKVARWFAWFQCAFLFGAAAGGLCFGKLGDHIGRSKAMAASILTYSALAAAASQAQSPVQFWLLWFFAAMGVGGIWPNGVALVAEAWASMSRPAVAGVIGTAANIGIFLMNTLATRQAITPDRWRWVMLVGAAPLLLGVVALFVVPESPRWLAARSRPQAGPTGHPSDGGIFRPPLLKVTLVAIVLATIPLIGGWGTANWMNPWADAANPSDPFLKARVGQARALTGMVGSLLGGWIASRLGRRTTYFLVSLSSLCVAQYIFRYLTPNHPTFLFWVAVLGFISGIYFGWLPLCLPEMFPTRVRSTGAGVGFNFGRIATAVTIFATGAMTTLFRGDYAAIGRLTSLLFVLGMLAVWLTPDTSRSQLEC